MNEIEKLFSQVLPIIAAGAPAPEELEIVSNMTDEQLLKKQLEAVDHFKRGRAYELEKVKSKLKKIDYWQNRAKRLEDTSVETLAADRVKQVYQIAKNNGITFQKSSKNSYEDRAVYKKGDVTISLLAEFFLDSKGVAVLDFYKREKSTGGWGGDYYRKGKRVMRIAVGKQTRVTNNVLESLL